MNLLPSMLIATTIIGGSGNVCADLNNVDVSALQNKLNNNCTATQVITGSYSDLESALKDLGVDSNSLKDCLKPASSNSNCPANNNPGASAPETDCNTSGTCTPETDKSTPDAGQPDNNKNTPEIPAAEAPGTETPTTDNKEQDTNKSYTEQVVDLVNAERAKAGLSALTVTDELNAAALIRAKETTQSFSHTRPNGSSFSSVLKENGISYRGAGENIAWGQATPEAVVNAWMNSEGHRANILNKNYTSIGVGYYLNNGTPYWTQLFTY